MSEPVSAALNPVARRPGQFSGPFAFFDNLEVTLNAVPAVPDRQSFSYFE
jgi:hypothetical protein